MPHKAQVPHFVLHKVEMHHTRYLCPRQQNATVQQEFASPLLEKATQRLQVTKNQYQGNLGSVIVWILGSPQNH
jgi:hypothetical protein